MTTRATRSLTRRNAVCAIGAAVLLLAAGPARAGGPGDPPGRWWFGMDLGAGQLHQTVLDFSQDSVRFYANFAGGVAINPQLLVGVEVGGWLLEASDYNDPSRGAAISPLFFTARIYPSKMSAFHIRIGGGLVDAWDNAWGTSQWGTGLEVGAGYDVRVRSRIYVTPFATFFDGKIGDLGVRAFTAGVGLNWR